MGFFNTDFLYARRLEWKNSIKTFQYKVGDTWYNATINASSIVGNKLVYDVLIPATPETAHKITGLRILDNNGSEAGYQSLNIERSGTQSLLTVFEFPIQEV